MATFAICLMIVSAACVETSAHQAYVKRRFFLSKAFLLVAVLGHIFALAAAFAAGRGA